VTLPPTALAEAANVRPCDQWITVSGAGAVSETAGGGCARVSISAGRLPTAPFSREA
jgi:hypothetical protein